MNNHSHHVAVLGASPKPARYANQCVRLLKEHGYRVTPLHPRFDEVEDLPVTHSLAEIGDRIDGLDDLTRGLFLAAKALDTTRPVLDASGYVVARQRGSAQPKVLATLSPDRTTYEDYTGFVGTDYTYIVRAIDAFGESTTVEDEGRRTLAPPRTCRRATARARRS
mgnify:CR=1 FL=1